MTKTIQIGIAVFDDNTGKEYSFYTVHLHLRAGDDILVDTIHGMKQAVFRRYGAHKPTINRWILGTREELYARIIREANVRMGRVTEYNDTDAYDPIPQAALREYFKK